MTGTSGNDTPPVLPVTDTLKTVDASGLVTGTPRRADMVAVQTPQGFRWDVLVRAHEAGASLGADEAVAATDDAGLVNLRRGWRASLRA